MLSLEGVNVSIGPVAILRGVNLDVRAGEFAGLIGRNGAGKTTVLRTIMGLLPAASGKLDFESQPLAGLPTHRRAGLGIGYMPEDRRLVPGLSAEENMLVPAWAAGIGPAGASSQLERIYGLVPELTALRARKALQLSGGQQKLVALGRALMAGRKLLLLDEPFEGLAPIIVRDLLATCRTLAEAGQTIMIVEQNVTAALSLADRAYILNNGHIIDALPAQALREHPETLRGHLGV
jgi:branched-chain amino acid transport system ATP-binding protein